MPENNETSQSHDKAIDWLDETIPVSKRFDDPYYSKADGLAETRHVFLDSNDLPARFANCTDGFTIAELGFGTGLNFLAACKLWRDTAPQDSHLHYISFERYPLSAEQIHKALSRWPEIERDAEAMLQNWNPEYEFFEFEDKNIEATVFFSDANVRLPQLDLKADVWFLDGFAPSKNPDLWSAELMADVGRHTRPDGTFATYTAAGWVRRNLIAAGFEVNRIPGHGTKREMMVGKKPAG